MIVSYLPEPEKHPLWPQIRELLKPAAIDCPEYEQDKDFVWIAFEGGTVFAAGTTALTTDGVAEIRACGGFRHKEWTQEALAAVEAWARQCGAKKMTMRGRKGWARYLNGWAVLGMEDERTIYEKAL